MHAKFILFGLAKQKISSGKKKKKKKKEEEEEEEEGSLSLERESLHLLTNYTKINLEATRFSHQLQII